MIRLLPPSILLVVALAGAGMTSVVYRAENAADRIRFETIAQAAADRVGNRVRQHIALLVSTHAFFAAAEEEVSRDALARFTASLGLEKDYEGIRGIGYARLIRTGEEAGTERDIAEAYGIDRVVWPDTEMERRTPIVLLEPPDEMNRAALGFDMFSDARRREAMLAALDSGAPRASAPVELAQEITDDKQAGFLVYIPFRPQADGPVAGFVYSPFRAGDLHDAALGGSDRLPLTFQTLDTTGEEAIPLFRSPGYGESDAYKNLKTQSVLDVAGRRWTFSVHATPEFRGRVQHLYSIVTGATSLLLALALAMSTRFQIKSVRAARALHAASQKAVQEKDLMLQEMKHRIKNSIARVLAIARQTAANSDTIEDFSHSFSARMHAMANAQDMLTRSHWSQADLRELLATELKQVLGSDFDERIDGPKVLLDERTTQALGLTFHELATNALKYGGISFGEGDLHISWTVTGRRKHRELQLSWVETSSGPIDTSGPIPTSGFGTRLIDANIRGELGGQLERELRPDGMSVRMVIPLADT
ncbi:CHASE domain-containing protein [Stappia indica]|uniref:histidine kinase n=1 Tax=Stappia indica TaxID=538381 RepID=A0A285SG01_9HYPH|nr:CHASE domain-containing protein [Stappia indica]SOC06605.1 sensor domain CHASE1-containing protein [Stappia indica]